MKYECKDCETKMCCFQSLAISKADVSRLEKELRKTTVGYTLIKTYNNYFTIAITGSDPIMVPHKCPFLIDNQCSVYDKRPDICRNFYCKATGLSKDEVLEINESNEYLNVIEIHTQMREDVKKKEDESFKDMLPHMLWKKEEIPKFIWKKAKFITYEEHQKLSMLGRVGMAVNLGLSIEEANRELGQEVLQMVKE